MFRLYSFSLLSICNNDCIASVSSLNEPDFLIHFEINQNIIISSNFIEIKKAVTDSVHLNVSKLFNYRILVGS